VSWDPVPGNRCRSPRAGAMCGRVGRSDRVPRPVVGTRNIQKVEECESHRGQRMVGRCRPRLALVACMVVGEFLGKAFALLREWRRWLTMVVRSCMVLIGGWMAS
jgi:hypothetical protein